MGLAAEWLAIDSTDPERVAAFWQAALGWERDPDADDEDEVPIRAPQGSSDLVRHLLFIRVPEGKAVKNRLHLDLRPDDQEAEVVRLISLGATRADVGQSADETWTVLADPEGNEFCVLRSRPTS